MSTSGNGLTAEMLCIGGPNAGHTLEAPNLEGHRVHYTSMPKFRATVPVGKLGDDKVKIRVHVYTVHYARVGGHRRPILVHGSLGSNWLGYVLERYAARVRKSR